jgi:hypothetical protein
MQVRVKERSTQSLPYSVDTMQRRHNTRILFLRFFIETSPPDRRRRSMGIRPVMLLVGFVLIYEFNTSVYTAFLV